MTSIITLLIMAMNLLTTVQNNPNVTPEFRSNAVSVANYAISIAQNALLAQDNTPVGTVTPTTTPVLIQTTPLPQPQTFGTINTVTTQPIMPQNTITIKRRDALTKDSPDSGIAITVRDQDGKYIEHPNVTVTMTKDGQPFDTFSSEKSAEPYSFYQLTRDLNTEKGVQYNHPIDGVGTYVFTVSGYGATTTETVVVN